MTEIVNELSIFDMTIKELLAYCKEHGITGYSSALRKGKAELCAFVRSKIAGVEGNKQQPLEKHFHSLCDEAEKFAEEFLARESEAGGVEGPMLIGTKIKVFLANSSIDGLLGKLLYVAPNMMARLITESLGEIWLPLHILRPAENEPSVPVSEADGVEVEPTADKLWQTYLEICSDSPKSYDRVHFACGCKGSLYFESKSFTQVPFVARGIFCEKHTGGSSFLQMPVSLSAQEASFRIWESADEPVPAFSVPDNKVGQHLKVGDKVKISCNDPLINGQEGVLLGIGASIARVQLAAGEYISSLSALAPVVVERSAIQALKGLGFCDEPYEDCLSYNEVIVPCFGFEEQDFLEVYEYEYAGYFACGFYGNEKAFIGIKTPIETALSWRGTEEELESKFDEVIKELEAQREFSPVITQEEKFISGDKVLIKGMDGEEGIFLGPRNGGVALATVRGIENLSHDAIEKDTSRQHLPCSESEREGIRNLLSLRSLNGMKGCSFNPEKLRFGFPSHLAKQAVLVEDYLSENGNIYCGIYSCIECFLVGLALPHQAKYAVFQSEGKARDCVSIIAGFGEAKTVIQSFGAKNR